MKQNRLPYLCSSLIPFIYCRFHHYWWQCIILHRAHEHGLPMILSKAVTDNDHKCICTQSTQGKETDNLFPHHVKFIISNSIAYSVERYIFQLCPRTTTAFLTCDLYHHWPHFPLLHVATSEKDKGGIHGQSEQHISLSMVYEYLVCLDLKHERTFLRGTNGVLAAVLKASSPPKR